MGAGRYDFYIDNVHEKKPYVKAEGMGKFKTLEMARCRAAAIGFSDIEGNKQLLTFNKMEVLDISDREFKYTQTSA